MIKTTARNAEKAVKTTAMGTVKTTEKGELKPHRQLLRRRLKRRKPR